MPAETAQTADYALRVLLDLQRQDAQTLADLAGQLGVGRSALSRVVATLHERALVTKSADNRYRLGPGLIPVGGHATHRLAALAEAELDRLAQIAGETVVLTVPDGDEGLVVAQRAGSRGALRVDFSVGFRHPLSSGASGQAILAFQDPTQRERHLGSDAGPVLEPIRRAGFARTEGQLRDGMVGLAVPVLDPDRAAVASLSVVVPAVRAASIEDALTPLREAAERLADAYRFTESTREGRATDA